MRAAARGAAAALRRLQAIESSPGTLQHLVSISTRSSVEAGSAGSSRSALGLLAAAAGAAAASYAFAARPVAHAEAPWKAEQGTASVPADERYARPAGVRGELPRDIVLYQYEVCPFCCKVKAFLDYHKIPYRCVEVNPLTKGELKWSQYKKVPVVVLDGQQLNDSSAIISRLAAEIEAGAASPVRAQAGSSAPPPAGKGWLSGWLGGSKGGGDSGSAAGASLAEEEKWRRWVDDWFVRVITVNIYRNMRESFQTFDYISQEGNFGWVSREAARVTGATLMWGISGKLRKKYGVEGDVRQELYKSANEWVAAVGSRRFLGGDQPCLADLAVFGVVRSVTGTDTFNDLMQSSDIGGWYARMFEAVGPSSRIQ